MAITDKEKGVWSLDQVYNKINQGSIWEYSGAPGFYAVGSNDMGTLGQNNRTYYSSPIQIPGTTWSSSVNATDQNVFAIKTDGTLWSWGRNYIGGLGQNQAEAQLGATSSPVQIPGTTWSVLGYSNVGQGVGAIKTDGTLYVWGENQTGALGLNDTNKRSSPTQIPGTAWSSLTINQHHGFSIKTTGQLWAWGNNYHGNLGVNSRTQYSSPVQVPGTTWSKIIAADGCVMATKTDGTLWAWGPNSLGLLGQNNRTYYSSPVQIPGTTWSDFSSKYRHVSAIKTDGTLWVWGYGNYGQIGNNTNWNVAGYSSPVQIPGTTWSNVAAGGYTTYAKKTDGTFWGWGRGDYGNLGLNTTANYSSPVQIPGALWDTFPSVGNGSFIIGTVNL